MRAAWATLALAACAHAPAPVHTYHAADGGIFDERGRRVYASPTEGADWCYCLRKDCDRSPQVDSYAGLTDGGRTLVIERIAPGCHIPNQYQVRVTDFLDPARAAEHVARPITSVAAGGGTVLFSDVDGLWRSTDGGDHWEQVEAPGIADAILIDRDDPSRWVILAFDDEMDPLAHLYATRTAGARWDELAPPEDIDDNDDEDEYIELMPTWIASPDGDLDHLDGGTQTLGDPDEEQTWRSRDGGQSWTDTDLEPVGPAQSARLGDDLFEATDDGLYRTRAGTRTRVSSQQAKPGKLW